MSLFNSWSSYWWIGCTTVAQICLGLLLVSSLPSPVLACPEALQTNSAWAAFQESYKSDQKQLPWSMSDFTTLEAFNMMKTTLESASSAAELKDSYQVALDRKKFLMDALIDSKGAAKDLESARSSAMLR